MKRRTFLRATAAAGAAAALAACGRRLTETMEMAPQETSTEIPPEPTLIPGPSPTSEPVSSVVYLIRTDDRLEGMRRAFDLLPPDVAGKRVLIKPNFNSADPPPGSTDPGMLAEAVRQAWQAGAAHVQIGDRAGMAVTRRVMEAAGVPALVNDLGVEWIDFSALPADQWEWMNLEDGHWPDGFLVARPVLAADAVINVCCLKTHRFGGHFTLSLKNAVGMVAASVPGWAPAYMEQLHASARQRSMIAEVNLAYTPALVVMDGVEAFTRGGPDVGTQVHAGVIVVGVDRIAVDAVGVALLRSFGTTPEVEEGPIFDQEQIRRAVELGLGVSEPGGIDLRGEAELVERVREELFAV